ncbi:MAG: PadR family transcriptional regulator [Thaumarchaeota archaeon]|nr:PadR family transcriptional regulator [Nitrososphaerota archaeon]
MTASFSKRWLHPQTVPRGFLRLYLLTILSRSPESGYSIIQKIDERTEGAWRPGAGTMYPLLKSLVRGGMVKATGAEGRLGSKTYSLTPKGRSELEAIRRAITTMGGKDRVMMRLFSDLLPGSVFIPMILSRYREGTEIFREKVFEIPQPDRSHVLKELKLFMESQIDWIASQLLASADELKLPAPRRRKKL